MITFTKGNLLDAKAEALVNTVNTVGVMGKGIALMFKDRFQENYKYYQAACKAGEVTTGKMFVTQTNELDGPRWIINFPTKQHWRSPSQLGWIKEGLLNLRKFLIDNQVKSVAIPPLGAGNGGLDWATVREEILAELAGLETEIIVYEPTDQYLNVMKRAGVEKLTPARALIAELIRRYWVMGMECSLLEVQKLAWFLERAVQRLTPNEKNPLDLQFTAHKFGPYAFRLQQLINNLDGSYLHCNKRISDADPLEVIWFDDKRKDILGAYLNSEGKKYHLPLESTAALIDGFESPFGMELLATVDWLLYVENVEPSVAGIRDGLVSWKGGPNAAERKNRIFDDRSIKIALDRLTSSNLYSEQSRLPN